MNDVWITGFGAITAVGDDASVIGEALVSGASGIRPQAALEGYPAGAIEPRPADREDRRLGPSAALFRQAAELAWRKAGLADPAISPDRVGVCDGSSVGPIAEILRRAADRGTDDQIRVRPSAIVQLMPGAGGAHFAQQHGLQGPVLHVNAGSVAGAAAIGEAALWVQSGRIDIAVAGGAESPLQPDLIRHFQAAGVLPLDPDLCAPCRPFDSEREGTIFGEGAGVLVLESAAHARRRGVEPFATLRGYGLTAEQHTMVAPDPTGAGVRRAAEMAMHGCERSPGWVKAHGTATRLGDAAELHGLRGLLGSELATTPVTGLKPTVGHCLGASSAVETVLTLIALRGGIVPPLVGTKALDPDLPRCELATEPRWAPPGDVLVLAEGFGGRCAALRLGVPGKRGRARRCKAPAPTSNSRSKASLRPRCRP